MFPIRHTYTSKFSSYSVALLLSLVFLILAAQPSQAAVVPGTKFSGAKTQVLRAPLSAMTGYDDEVLDWRRPMTEIRFDLPPGDWANAMSLDLRALPQGTMGADTPLRISLNGGKAVEIESAGQQFEADVTFPASKLRRMNNTLRISFDAPAGATCLNGDHGAWVVDMARSTIKLNTRTQARDFRLSEIERRLKGPFTAPKTVGIIARGTNRGAYEALGAQGIGLRMKNLPDFKIGKTGDFTLLIGTRSAIKSKLNDKAIALSKGAQIAVRDGRPMTLVLTGDTDAQVLSSVKAFARYHLPSVSREITTPGELEMQMPFTKDGVQARGKAILSTLGGTEFDASYRPKPVKLSFHVDDPKNASAELVLDLSRNDIAGSNSRIDVTLNGRALGFATLDRRRKRVGFDIPAGVFRASQNELIITPTLEAISKGCAATNYQPAIIIGRKSYLKIDNRGTDSASLSRLAGSGAPFSNQYGANAAVVTQVRRERDRAAVLTVLAQLAKSSGAGWSEAQFASDLSAIDPKRNILFVGEMGADKSILISTAPRSFSDAARGVAGVTLAQNDAPVITASLNAREAFTLAANTSAQSGSKLKASGLAAIYRSPLTSNAVIGVITTSGQNDFARAVKPLTDEAHWDRLQGGVVRWNAKTLMMTQAANPALLGASPSALGQGDGYGGIFGLRDKAASGFAALSQKFRRSAPEFDEPQTQPSLAPAPKIAPVQNPPKLRAPAQDVAALSPALRQNVSTPVLTMPALRGRTPARMTIDSQGATTGGTDDWLSIFDTSGFDYGYFKANLGEKTTQLRNTTMRLIGGQIGLQEMRQSWSSLKSNSQIWLIIMAIILILGLLSVSPKSRHKYY